MNFRVPQFIEVEDKLVGPLSLKQFIYLLGGLGGSFLLFKLLPIYLSIFLILPIVGLALALSFLKINNQPFVSILQAAISYYMGSRLYVWKREEKKKAPAKTEKPQASSQAPLTLPTLTESKLRDLAWSLDIKNK